MKRRLAITGIALWDIGMLFRVIHGLRSDRGLNWITVALLIVTVVVQIAASRP
jgi:hypothetical protein